jgi:four helix bundle protein
MLQCGPSRAPRSRGQWRKAHHLVLAVYRVTNDYKQEEQRSLAEEIRCAARRVPPAIVEGCAQLDDAAMRPFLVHAVGRLWR